MPQRRSPEEVAQIRAEWEERERLRDRSIHDKLQALGMELVCPTCDNWPASVWVDRWDRLRRDRTWLGGRIYLRLVCGECSTWLASSRLPIDCAAYHFGGIRGAHLRVVR